MRKFMAFYGIAWQESLTYRAETLVWFVLELSQPLVINSLWWSLYQSGRLTPEKFSYLVSYYLFTLIISRVTSANFEDWLIGQIKDGHFSFYLLKPLSIQAFLYALELSWRSTGMIYIFPLLLATPTILSHLPAVTFNWTGVFFLPLLLIVIYTQRFFFSFIISLGAFWMQQAKSLVHLKWMLEGIFGGAWLPLTFFPGWWQTLSRFTPFYYWFFFPIEALISPMSINQLLTNIGFSLIWVVILKFISSVLWKTSITKYSAVNG